jgi:hypothetical protein
MQPLDYISDLIYKALHGHRIDNDAILIVEVFNKTTQETPPSVIRTCKMRLADYDAL